MHSTIARRIEQLERALAPDTQGPAFVMATSAAEADATIERLRTEYPRSMPPALFVMVVHEPTEASS